MYSIIIILLWLSVVLAAEGWMPRSTYVIATEPTMNLSDCPVNASRCLTLNDLINSGSRWNPIFEHDENVVFQSGTHLVNGTQNQYLYTERHNLIFRGESNATIICAEDFVFVFHAIESITLSQLYLYNCKGSTYDYPNFDKVSTLLFVDVVHNIMIDKIHITSNGSIGIALYFEFNLFHSIWLRFRITNSTISTGDIGVYSGGTHERETNIDDDSVLVEITGTDFEGSCLRFETISFVSYTIWKSNFEHCQCSPVLFFNGVLTKIILREITVMDNESPVLMQVGQAKYIRIDGKLLFHRNKGVSIVNESTVEITSTSLQFINNTVASTKDIPGTILFIRNSSFHVFDSTLYFRNNHGQLCGGITATDKTSLTFILLSRADFVGNTGKKGGALSLYKESTMQLQSNEVYINFHNNTATKGGGVYVEDTNHIKTFSYDLTKSVIKVVVFENDDDKFTGASAITFSNNTAHIGGSTVYGGWVDWSVDENGAVTFNPRIEETIVLQDDDDVASSPLRACLCFDNIPNCTITKHTIDIYPGQTVTLNTVAVGQRFGTVTTFMTIDIMKSSGVNYIQGTIADSQYVQTTHRSCTPLNYTIMSPNKREQFIVRPTISEVKPRFEQELLDKYPQLGTLFEQLSITLIIKECPLAFPFDKNLHKCTCLPSLGWLGLGCDLNSFRILRNKDQWIGIAYNYSNVEENSAVIVHQHCPFDYCREDKKSLSVQVEDGNKQCAYNRGGILCGGCQVGFSNILGSSKCKRCSNLMLFAVIPAVLVAGILLILFLMGLDLTVSTGTINGLILYANIIEAQHAIFFTPYSSSSFLRKFIAWLNLDLGVEMCFSNNLDAYTKTWLQFLFPLYMWLLVAAIILSSHFSTLASRLSGNNAVQVLAALFLLSYTKLLRLVITVFSYTELNYPDGYKRLVWLYDGNIDYLRGKHILLFIGTLLALTFLSIPYTLSLVSIQWLFKLSHYRALFWVNKLKPLFDAYTGPYKSSHRYWTGLLLLVRIILLFSFSVNRNNNPTTNLFIIMLFSTFLIAWLYFTRWVYKKFLNNCLEIFFLGNLSITSTAMLFQFSNNHRSSAVIFVSSGLTCILFSGIVLYHAQRQLFRTRAGAKLKKKLALRFKRENKDIEELQPPAKHDSPKKVTHTVIELRQPLLEKNENEEEA